MRRGLVSDYFGSHGAADLCAGSWCNLDYALAGMWGAGLERTGTLVGGAGCCDFRFRVTAAPKDSPDAEPELRLPMLAQ